MKIASKWHLDEHIELRELPPLQPQGLELAAGVRAAHADGLHGRFLTLSLKKARRRKGKTGPEIERSAPEIEPFLKEISTKGHERPAKCLAT